MPLVAGEGDEILNAHGKFVLLAMCGATEDPHICAAVVRAVNAHAALVSALEAMCEEQRHPSPAYEAAQKLLASLE